MIWAYDRYHNAYEPGVAGPEPSRWLDQHPWLKDALAAGYLVALVDARGTGTSTGVWRGPFSTEEAWDTYDVTEWFAAQSWCDGAVGMYGRSYLGITQYLAAAVAPPHLRAVIPEMALFDIYGFGYSGGVLRDDFARGWSASVRALDERRPARLPGETPEDAARRAEDRRGNHDAYALFKDLPFSDSVGPSGAPIYPQHSPSAWLDRLARSHVAIFHIAGWFDLWPRDALLWFHNYTGPQRLLIGPWAHTGDTGADLGAERLRWYDRWLRGRENTAGDAPIRYFTLGTRGETSWRTTPCWPPEAARPDTLFLRAGAGSAGHLAGVAETRAERYVARLADLTATTGTATRWTNGYGGPFGYKDLSENDARGLTFTTPPLEAAVEVTGHPIAHLWISATAPDIDCFVYLEDVDPHGYAQYVTEGVLRASHRALHEPPYRHLGLPYHRSQAGDVLPLPPGEPVELVFDLLPTSVRFREGSRIRVTITAADRDNAGPLTFDVPPELRVHCDASRPSRIVLPVVPSAGADDGAEVVYV